MTTSSRKLLFYAGECAITVLLALFAFSCSLSAASRYPDNQLISCGIGLAAVLYMGAIGAGSRWGIVFPFLVLALFLLIGITQSFSWGEWLGRDAWMVYIPVALSLFAYFWHRRQAWLLPLAALCSLSALIAQLCYTPWKIWYIFDTMGLIILTAETTVRSMTTLYYRQYFYTAMLERRKNRPSIIDHQSL